jgi:hypothetical protein
MVKGGQTELPFNAPAPGAHGPLLSEARAELRAHLPEGVTCPCCDQYAKLYRRTITATMARSLILIDRWCRAHPSEWLHIPSYLTQLRANATNDAALLRHWGLIEGQGGEREDGSKRVGFYRVTELGHAFANRAAQVPCYALLYSQELLGLTGEPVGIEEALGTRFNYAELMEAAWPGT